MQIYMGIYDLAQLENYWSSDPVLQVRTVSHVTTAKRYKKIVETLHINDNTTVKQMGEVGYNKLHKVQPLFDSLNENFKKYFYEPSKSLSVDEAIIPFKGRSIIKQFMPMKPVKRGYKVWCLADAKTGYVLSLDI